MFIPVIVTQAGLKDVVYNTFYIGDDCDVTIVAGCGIHNCGVPERPSTTASTRFYVRQEQPRVRYVERHYGEGDRHGARTS